MNNKRSPYNKTSRTSKDIIEMFRDYAPILCVYVMAEVFGRSVANIRYLKGVANGDN